MRTILRTIIVETKVRMLVVGISMSATIVRIRITKSRWTKMNNTLINKSFTAVGTPNSFLFPYFFCRNQTILLIIITIYIVKSWSNMIDRWSINKTWKMSSIDITPRSTFVKKYMFIRKKDKSIWKDSGWNSNNTNVENRIRLSPPTSLDTATRCIPLSRATRRKLIFIRIKRLSNTASFRM